MRYWLTGALSLGMPQTRAGTRCSPSVEELATVASLAESVSAVIWLSMNETYRSILGLRAIRAYQDRPVSQDDLDRVFEAARWTGSAKNLQNWAVINVRDQDQIGRLAECGKRHHAAPSRVGDAGARSRNREHTGSTWDVWRRTSCWRQTPWAWPPAPSPSTRTATRPGS